MSCVAAECETWREPPLTQEPAEVKTHCYREITVPKRSLTMQFLDSILLSDHDFFCPEKNIYMYVKSLHLKDI